MKVTIIIIILLIIFGIARIPLERNIDAYFAKKNFDPPKLELELRDKIGQNAFIAALGGYRSLLASILNLQAITYWQRTNWAGIDSLYQIITKLQPQIIFYWRDAKRFLGDDAVSHYRNVSQENKLIRNYYADLYFNKALTYLNKGIESTKPNYTLHMEKGMLYNIRKQDWLNAGKSFLTASKQKNAPEYLVRRAAYEFAKVPGMERKAYKMLKDLFLESRNNHLPTLLVEGYNLERILFVPAKERIFSFYLIPDDVLEKVIPPLLNFGKYINNDKHKKARNARGLSR